MDQSLINDFHTKGLPMELIYIILRYTWTPQSSDLLEDVKSYVFTIKQIKDRYYNYWKRSQPFESFNWLENDILMYANKNRPLMSSWIDVKMISILSRSIIYSKLMELPIYNGNVNVEIVINTLWGLFTVDERLEFIEHKGYLL